MPKGSNSWLVYKLQIQQVQLQKHQSIDQSINQSIKQASKQMNQKTTQAQVESFRMASYRECV
jgi:cell division septum initiation protein DivIVA